jgi:two-component system sensor histidine kinase RegB
MLPPHRPPPRIGPRTLARTLAWLRLCAIAGQSAAVLVVAQGLGLAIPELHLFVGIGALAVFAAGAAWRLTQRWPVGEPETVAHVAVDTLVLGYLLYFTGGASNPFVTLLLVPIALSAAALSMRGVMAVAALSGLAYLLLLYWYVPLPMLHMHGFTDFHLHVAGMAVNFVITALMLGFFITRLATALRAQQAEVQRVRERALRDEGILAIATQAAGAAHEMNTPLSTLRTLLPELRREHADDTALAADLALLETQVERCRAGGGIRAGLGDPGGIPVHRHWRAGRVHGRGRVAGTATTRGGRMGGHRAHCRGHAGTGIPALLHRRREQSLHQPAAGADCAVGCGPVRA